MLLRTSDNTADSSAPATTYTDSGCCTVGKNVDFSTVRNVPQCSKQNKCFIKLASYILSSAFLITPVML